MTPTPLRPVTTWPALVGRVLAELRKERGLTQEDIAAAVGVGQAAWSKIERGDSALTVEQLFAASQRMELAASEVLRIADLARRDAEEKGVEVELARHKGRDALGAGLVLIAGAALGVLVLEAMKTRRR
jgi:transcriptional regulator with XRE-family HTH domain